MDPRKIIVRPIVTEKTSNMREENNRYVFEVASAANKIEIKSAVEEVFDVSVVNVTTWFTRGKLRRRGQFVGKTPDRKRAAVTLKEGDNIPLFEQV